MPRPNTWWNGACWKDAVDTMLRNLMDMDCFHVMVPCVTSNLRAMYIEGLFVADKRDRHDKPVWLANFMVSQIRLDSSKNFSQSSRSAATVVGGKPLGTTSCFDLKLTLKPQTSNISISGSFLWEIFRLIVFPIDIRDCGHCDALTSSPWQSQLKSQHTAAYRWLSATYFPIRVPSSSLRLSRRLLYTNNYLWRSRAWYSVEFRHEGVIAVERKRPEYVRVLPCPMFCFEVVCLVHARDPVVD